MADPAERNVFDSWTDWLNRVAKVVRISFSTNVSQSFIFGFDVIETGVLNMT